MLSPRQVADLDVAFLQSTATAWETLVTKAKESEDEFRRQVLGPLDNGAWTGKDADKALLMLRFFATDLVGVQAEAGAGASIMREAYTQLLAAKNTMTGLYEEARLAGLTIAEDGVVTGPPTDSKESADRLQALADGLAPRIAAVRQQATDADALAAEALKANTDFGPKQDFNTKSLGADPVADALRVQAMLGRVEDLDATELQSLRFLMADNAANPVFAEKLALDLGPRGMIDESGRLAQLFAASGKGGGKAKREDIKQLQALLGVTLATASPALARPENAAWMQELKAACEALVPVGKSKGYPGQPMMYGYQPFSALLGNGTYDATFLQAVATNMRQFETDAGQPPIWQTTLIPRPNFPFDLNGGTPGYDPAVGLMAAFAKNPAAATTFFNSADSNLSYYLEKRPWLPGRDGEGAKATLGMAVEAATTGRVPNGQPGIPPAPNPPHHTPEQAEVMRKTLTILGDPGRLGGAVPPEMLVSVGNMVADHLLDNPKNEKSLHQELVAPSNGRDEADRAFLKTLQAVAHNPEAYATVTTAETYIMAQTLGLPPEDQHIPVEIRRAVTASGVLTEIRNQAIGESSAGEISEATWNRRYQYHLTGGLANYSLIIPDPLQRYMDIVANHGLDGDVSRINQEASEEKFENYWTQYGPTAGLMEEWAANNHTDYSSISQDFVEAFNAGAGSVKLRNP